MQENENAQTKGFSDYLSILYKWKKLLIINLIIITALGTLYSFLIPEQFKASSIVMVAADNQSEMSGIGSILSGNFSMLGSQLFGSPTQSFDLILGVLNSRTALTNVIKRFNLFKYYDIDDRNIDKTIKAFRNDLVFEPTDNGLLEISVINKDPVLSANISNYFVKLADSMYIELNIEKARNNRYFIEKRYQKNIDDLKAAEDSFYIFQKKYGVAVIPEQLVANIQASANIETELIKQELTAEMLKNRYGEDFPQYKVAMKEVKVLQAKVDELKNSQSLYKSSNILFPFKDVPDISIQYYRNYREIEIQNKILEFVLPLYEQALVEEQKSIPNLIVVDQAVPPELKYSPKKALIILIFFFLGLFIHLPLIFRGDKILILTQVKNSMEEKEKAIYNKISNLYKLRIN